MIPHFVYQDEDSNVTAYLQSDNQTVTISDSCGSADVSRLQLILIVHRLLEEETARPHLSHRLLVGPYLGRTKIHHEVLEQEQERQEMMMAIELTAENAAAGEGLLNVRTCESQI